MSATSRFSVHSRSRFLSCRSCLWRREVNYETSCGHDWQLRNKVVKDLRRREEAEMRRTHSPPAFLPRFWTHISLLFDQAPWLLSISSISSSEQERTCERYELSSSGSKVQPLFKSSASSSRLLLTTRLSRGLFGQISVARESDCANTIAKQELFWSLMDRKKAFAKDLMMIINLLWLIEIFFFGQGHFTWFSVYIFSILA